MGAISATSGLFSSHVLANCSHFSSFFFFHVRLLKKYLAGFCFLFFADFINVLELKTGLAFPIDPL